MKLKLGIKIIDEIEGTGTFLQEGVRFRAAYRYFYNKGDPIVFNHAITQPFPKVVEIDGKRNIGYDSPTMEKSNRFIDETLYSRGSGLLPGLYYGMMGMKIGGYRFVRIPPEFMFGASPFQDVKPNSVIKVEIFLLDGKSI